jgi:ABC-type bacteriocin/lantibiotic exporter with double-glycine peptidase domain
MLLIVISFSSILFTIAKGYSFLELGEHIGLKVKNFAFKSILKREMADIERVGKTSLVHTITSDCECVKLLVSGLVESSAEHFFTLMVGLAISFIYCWQITLVSLFLIPLTLVGGKLQQRFLGGLTENSDRVHRKTHEIVLQSIVHNRTVKSLNLQDHLA